MLRTYLPKCCGLNFRQNFCLISHSFFGILQKFFTRIFQLLTFMLTGFRIDSLASRDSSPAVRHTFLENDDRFCLLLTVVLFDYSHTNFHKDLELHLKKTSLLRTNRRRIIYTLLGFAHLTLLLFCFDLPKCRGQNF